MACYRFPTFSCVPLDVFDGQLNLVQQFRGEDRMPDWARHKIYLGLDISLPKAELVSGCMGEWLGVRALLGQG